MESTASYEELLLFFLSKTQKLCYQHSGLFCERRQTLNVYLVLFSFDPVPFFVALNSPCFYRYQSTLPPHASLQTLHNESWRLFGEQGVHERVLESLTMFWVTFETRETY